ncbi:MAG: 4-alpha-glucanotransferase [Acidiphilium sp.]|nr:4-alpha-glucanotransferase [Acidiphilium sp.]
MRTRRGDGAGGVAADRAGRCDAAGADRGGLVRALMSDEALFSLADRAGLSVVWHDVFGTAHHVAPEVLRPLLAALGHEADSDGACAASLGRLDEESRATPKLVTALAGGDIRFRHDGGAARLTREDGTIVETRAEPVGDGWARLPPVDEVGYHTLAIGERTIGIAVAPARAFTMRDALDRAGRGGKAWGLAAQVYGLPRANDGGIGDFAALAELARRAAERGADAIAISPIHALYASEPGHYGPYGPSSRMALNPVYAALDCADPVPDPEDVTGESPGGLVDWRRFTPPRYAALRAAFAQERHEAAFRAFLSDPPPALLLHARFEALVAHQLAHGAGRDWRHWPDALRSPATPEVAAILAAEGEQVEFHLFAQYRVRADLRRAQLAATGAGMAVGLIADLAVGADPAGSDAWGRPLEVLRGASVGAPPDEFNRRGQNWGLTAFSPRGLRDSGFSALRDMLGAALEPTGGVRIDHAMGLSRLWIIPEGGEAKDGCFLRYPFDDMRRIVMLESVRHRGIVVAEDLGTVPEGFRDGLATGGIAGMSILWFERDGDRFVPPAHWRADTAALTTTHDLPTAAGWWRGTDIGWRERLHIPGEDEEKRAFDRGCLWDACVQSGAAGGEPPGPDEADAIADAVIAHVATASSDLVILPIEDVMALREQPNIPGTIDEHPNWRRRLPEPVEACLAAPRVAARLKTIDGKRRSS